MQARPAWETTLLDWATTALETREICAPTRAVSRGLSEAYESCSRITLMHSRTFYLASGLLPEPKRHAARALYAFCRVTDDTVDLPQTSAADRQVALLHWRDQALAPHAPTATDLTSQVALAWSDARQRYGIPVGYAQQLIDGVARDLVQPRYDSFDDLAAYSYGVASTVGLMAMHIIGFAGPTALPYAVKLGVALQMTNILRDVGEDWRVGRLYLPAQDLHEYRITEADIAGMTATGVVSDRWRSFMRFQIARNRQLYAAGRPGIGLLNRDGRFAIAAAADLYCAILSDIEAHDYNVFTRRAHVSKAGKLARMPGIWWRSMRA